MKHQFTSLAALLMAGTMSAQVYTLEGCQFTTYDVTNEGVVVGTRTVNYPFELWYPLTDYSFKTIGGVSAGYGIGGNARFSADGKKVSATAMGEFITARPEWTANTLEAYKECNFVRISQIPYSGTLLALLYNKTTENSVLIYNATDYKTWMGGKILEGVAATDICPINALWSLVPAENGKLYSTTRQGVKYVWNGEIDAVPEGNKKPVKKYTSAEFTLPNENGCKGIIGVEYGDGTGGIWVAANPIAEFQTMKLNTTEAEGVTGVPADFDKIGDIFYMATKNGKILKSEDLGKTWTEIAGVEGGGVGFSRIRINPKNSDRIIAIGGSHVYFTLDGGKNWDMKNTGYAALSDACWTDENTVYLAAAEGVFKSTDCKNWELDLEGNYASITYPAETLLAGGYNGDLRQLSSVEVKSDLATASLYDIETGEWTNFECFNQIVEDVMSAPWGISGDGNVVVGQAYTYNPKNPSASVHSHATAWINGEPTDLGSKFSNLNRFTRATAASYDGSVIVGFQDLCGPWFGAKWVKNADGVYEEKILLKNPTMNEDDITWSDNLAGYYENVKGNVLGRATVVTPDGKWIGGVGSGEFATTSPWLYNDENGLVLLGNDEVFPGGESDIAAVNSDATMAFGHGGIYPVWIWTPEDGVRDLNEYLASGGINLSDISILDVKALSANGRYLIGECNDLTGICAYMIDLSQWKKGAGVQLVEQTKATVYPNPVSDQLHVDLPFSGIETSMRIYSMQGSLVKSQQTTSLNNVIDVTGLQPGFYLLNVEAQGAHKTFKIQIKR